MDPAIEEALQAYMASARPNSWRCRNKALPRRIKGGGLDERPFPEIIRVAAHSRHCEISGVDC